MGGQVGAGGVEALGGGHAAQRDVRQEQDRGQRDDRERHAHEERLGDAGGVDVLEDRAQAVGHLCHAWQGAGLQALGPLGGVRAQAAQGRGEVRAALLDAVRDHVGHHGAHHGDADAAAQGAEEGDAGAGDAHLPRVRGVLHHEHEVLHGHADAGAEQEHVEGHQPEGGVVVQGAEQGGAGDQQDGADHEPALPHAGAGDEAADHRGGHEQAEDHRDGHEAGLGRRRAAGQLHVLGQVDGGAEHGQARGDRGDRREGEGAVAEEGERDERLGDAQLGHDEQDGGDGGAAEHPRGGGAGPVEVATGAGDPDQQQRGGRGQEHDAEVVDGHLLALAVREVEGALHHHQGDDGEGHRHEEVPAPAPQVGDHAAGQGAAHRGHGHHGAEQAHVAAALTRADDVRHDHLAERDEAAAAQALHGAADDQEGRIVGEPGRRGGGDEDRQGDLEEDLAVDEVGQLAPDRGGDGRGEQGRGDDPGVGGLVAADVVDDHRHRGRDHRVGDHRDEHAQQEAGQGLEHGAVARGVGGGTLERGGAGRRPGWRL